MKSPFPKDDISPKKKAHGGDLFMKKKFPYPKVNISPKLNIFGGHPFEEKCPLLEGDVSLKMTTPKETSPRGQCGFKKLSFPLKEKIQRHLPHGSYITCKGKTFIGGRINEAHQLNRVLGMHKL
jgi:hypothetical protein